MFKTENKISHRQAGGANSLAELHNKTTADTPRLMSAVVLWSLKHFLQNLH